MTLDEFTNILKGRLETLLDTNDTRKRPWTRRDFILYTEGAIETFFFFNGNPNKADVDAVMCNVVIDAGVLDRLPQEV